MPAYLYRAGPAPGAPSAPDADALLDALANQLLAEPDVGAAISQVQRAGIPQRDGTRQPGSSALAQSVQRAQRALTRRYSFEEINREFSGQVRAAVREELQTIEKHFQARADAREAAAAEWRRALEDLAAHAAGTPPEEARPLRQHEAERRYEDLYRQVSEATAEARADQAEERHRLQQIEQLPAQTIDRAKALEDYSFLSESAATRIRGVNAVRPRMSGLAASEWRHRFTGEEAVDGSQAEAVVAEMRGLDRLEGQLRGGRVQEIDPEVVGERLGTVAMHAVEGLQSLLALLKDAGYLVVEGDAIRLSPRGIRRLGERALREVFTQLKRTVAGEHYGAFPGGGGPQGPSVRPYEAGDAFDLHLNETLFSAARRAPAVPLRLQPGDFRVHESEAAVQSATVLMIDLSTTMLRYGRILAAKQVALALHTLITTRFPKDTLELVGFSSTARSLTVAELPNVAPRPGQPFTNIQDGLRLATRLLRRRRGTNRQIILITDGEPTAVTDDRGQVRSRYPPDEAVFERTLHAVRTCTAHGIVINIIMLDRRPDLVEFVRRMAHLNRGRAFFCTPETIGRYVIYDYLRGKRFAVGSP